MLHFKLSLLRLSHQAVFPLAVELNIVGLTVLCSCMIEMAVWPRLMERCQGLKESLSSGFLDHLKSFLLAGRDVGVALGLGLISRIGGGFDLGRRPDPEKVLEVVEVHEVFIGRWVAVVSSRLRFRACAYAHVERSTLVRLAVPPLVLPLL